MNKKKFLYVAIALGGLLAGCTSSQSTMTHEDEFPARIQQAHEILLNGIGSTDIKQVYLTIISRIALDLAKEEMDYWQSRLIEKDLPWPDPEWQERYDALQRVTTGFEGGSGYGFVHNMRNYSAVTARAGELREFYKNQLKKEE